MRRLLLILIPLALLPWLWSSGKVDAAQQTQAPAGAKVVPKTHPALPPEVAAVPPAVAAEPPAMAGAETCALCHSDISTKFSSNPHAKLALMHGGKGVTCESCHGSGQAHVESGGDPTKILQLSKMSAKRIDATCLACHATAHPNFLRSDHAKADVGCESCHSIHGFVPAAKPADAAPPAAGAALPPAVGAPSTGPQAPADIAAQAAPSAAAVTAPAVTPAITPARKTRLSARFFEALKPDAGIGDPLQRSAASLDAPAENPNLLRASQPQLCFSCHSDIRSAFSQPFHHKVNEGLMKCTDCHDSHGTFGNNQLRSTADQNMVCAKCHTETRGPFVFEHVAVKSEGCLGCHSPHGSQNARLLNVPNINQMCNQCHSPVSGGTIHGLSAGSAAVQSCVSCHTMIHGSNINSAFIR